MTENITKVGVGVALIDKEGRILLGKRKGSHGEGEWAMPGGHLEYGESFADCAWRELTEEIGPQVKYTGLHVVSVINLTEYFPKHYIDIGMVAYHVKGTPEVMEPEKVECWQWFDPTDLPSPIFATVQRIVNAASGGARFYDC